MRAKGLNKTLQNVSENIHRNILSVVGYFKHRFDGLYHIQFTIAEQKLSYYSFSDIVIVEILLYACTIKLADSTKLSNLQNMETLFVTVSC